MASSSRRRRPCALLVDDDPFVLAILSELLDECGINTVRASDVGIGLQVLSEEASSVDLLVTDLVMPELGGDALVMAVRELGSEATCHRGGQLLPRRGSGRALRGVGADAVIDKAGGLAPVVAAARSLLAARAQAANAQDGRPALLDARGTELAGASVPLFRIGLTRRH